MLDERDGGRQPILISRHADELRRVERGYGNAQKPEDDLESFSAYLRENINLIPALVWKTYAIAFVPNHKELLLCLIQGIHSKQLFLQLTSKRLLKPTRKLP